MSLDSDVALIGTGLAPLVAAQRFVSEGKSVLILNPDWDFFLEDSEFPLDPLYGFGTQKITAGRVSRNSLERAMAELSPIFPGSLETWPKTDSPKDSKEFHDPAAPHVRSRSRLWIASDESRLRELEDFYVEASDAGLNPQILEGLAAAKRFPGFSGKQGDYKGILLPQFCDVDVSRYRNGILEFVRERISSDRILSGASVELMPGGLRFYANGSAKTARIREGVLVFWTPKLTNWVLAQARRAEMKPVLPRGIRVWEQWSLVSREPIDPSTVGILADSLVWADLEGNPSGKSLDLLTVLRSGPLMDLSSINAQEHGLNWASTNSFSALHEICQGFLKWDRFSVRGMKPRAVFEWERERDWYLTPEVPGEPAVKVICGCEGSVVDVVRNARMGCERLEEQLEFFSS